MGRRLMRNAVKLTLIAVAMIVLAVLAGQCAYNAGEWAGRH